MLAVEAGGQRIDDVFLGGKLRIREKSPKILLPAGPADITCRPPGIEPRKRLAPQLVQQRNGHEARHVPAHLDPAYFIARVAGLGRLRPDRPFGPQRIERFVETAIARGRRLRRTVRERHRYPVPSHFNGRLDRQRPTGTAALQRPRKTTVVIAENRRPAPDSVHAVRIDAAVLRPVDIGPPQLARLFRETDAVAGGKRDLSAHPEPLPTRRDNRPDRLAERLGRIERSDPGRRSVQEIMRRAAREALGGIGLEIERDAPLRGPFQIRPPEEYFIQPATVPSHDVAHIGHILQPSLDLEGADSGVDHLLEPVR